MKHISRVIIAIFMAILMGTLLPVQVFADTPDYISEIKIGMGKWNSDEDSTSTEALNSLDGYTVLKDKSGNPVDLNQNAGSNNIGAKGQKCVYLGYKTTKDRSDAVTDLALMNMKGGYDVAEYDALFDAYLNSQVAPLVQKYIAMLKEYRANTVSKNAYNKAKAQYVRGILNKFIDDDTGMPLGDLFLTKTKEELGGAYFALSEAEKKKHADLTTIIAQSNGQATMLMQSLLARAGDTNTNTWMERFAKITYDDLEKSTGKAPTDAQKELDKLYNDAAQTIADEWNTLKTQLDSVDDMKALVESFDEDACQKAIDDYLNMNPKASAKTKKRYEEAYTKATQQMADVVDATEIIAVCEKLENINYGDETLLDFFTQEYEDISGDNINVLYPFVASMTAGQKAALEFVSLREFVYINLTDKTGYKSAKLDEIPKASIYSGVDRGIYQKGGVAITTAARRKGALEAIENDEEFSFSVWPYIAAGITAISAVCVLGSGLVYSGARQLARTAAQRYIDASKSTLFAEGYAQEAGEIVVRLPANHPESIALESAKKTSKFWGRLTIGFSVAFVLLSLFTVYLGYKEMCDYYDVEFTPIPHYMVDEKDIIGYNSKGEKVMIKNQSAYYKAVECNRKEGDDRYDKLDTCADVNGDVGKQWLALYAVKNEIAEPIIASSLQAVVGSNNIPAGYSTGIHMFGSDSAFNMNSSLYDWNNDAKSVYVYFQTDDSAPSTAGANFTAGTIALSAGIGIAVGAVITAFAMKTKTKKEDNKAVAV